MTPALLAVAELGDPAAPAIVFLHGGNVAGWMWEAQLPAFPDFHVLVPDLPGFGANNHLPWVSVGATADDIAQVIRQRASTGQAHIVGLSLGSSVAIEVGIRHPDVVESMFLASPTVTPITVWTRRLATFQLRFWEKRWFWTALARAYRLPQDSVAQFVTTGLGIRVDTVQRVLDEVGRGIAPDRLAKLPRPVLAVGGGRDTVSVRRDSLAALAATGTRTAIAPGLHHQWNIEDVNLFNRAVREWIVNRALITELVPGPATPPE